MKVLITGCCGLLGTKLVEIFKNHGFEVYGTDFLDQPDVKGYFMVDILKKEDVQKLFTEIFPEVVVHTAAYTNVDGCEKEKKNAMSTNFTGTKILAESSEVKGAKFVYISTDYVFSGEDGNYNENDDTNPISYYGLTKLKGEETVKEICSDYIIARSSVLYGSNKKNFVTWVIDSLRNGEEINIVTDQFVSPTLNIDLSEQLIALIENDASGIYHTTGKERISRYNFVQSIADVFGLDKNLIKPVRMTDINWIAPRPLDSSLDVSKITVFKKPLGVEESLKLLKDEMEGLNLKDVQTYKKS